MIQVKCNDGLDSSVGVEKVKSYQSLEILKVGLTKCTEECLKGGAKDDHKMSGLIKLEG